MIIKAVSLFLIAMLVLAMFGKLRMPARPGGKDGKGGKGAKVAAKRLDARKCPDCGAYVIGPDPCPCQRRNR